MTSRRFDWYCYQIGAREHYAIPRALHKAGMLGALVTDLWVPDSNSLSRLPGNLGARFRTRFARELSDANVIGFNKSAMWKQISSRLYSESGWDEIISRNNWFQKQVLSNSACLPEDENSVVFSYSYAARDIFQRAAETGCKTVLGQIDPGPAEVELVQRVREQHGLDPIPVPASSYWDSWREECSLADAIVTNSPWSNQLLIEAGIDEKKLTTIPLVYESDQTNTDHQLPEQPPAHFEKQRPLRVLYLGQVIARKGVFEMAAAARLLGDAPVRWTVAGGGDEQLLAELEQIASVELVGQVARDQVHNYYSCHDVFILPTHSDGFALTQLEAAANGIPIIASRNCGDVVEHMKDGILLREVSGEAIAGAVMMLVDNPELLSRLREKMSSRKVDGLDKLILRLANVQLHLEKSES